MSKSKLHLYLLSVSFLGMLLSCSKVPEGIIPEKQTQHVLLDMYLAEAMIGEDPKMFRDDEHKEALFQSVFNKYGITQALYDSSLVWYGENLDIYMKVYERMLRDISDLTLQLGDVQARALSDMNDQDSVNIWTRKSHFTFSSDNVGFNGITFNLNPETHYSSGSSFEFQAKVWGVVKDMKHYPQVRLFIEQKDTTLMLERAVDSDGRFSVKLASSPANCVRRVFGSFWMDNRDVSYSKIYIDSISLYKYNYKSDFTEIKKDEPK